MQNSHSFSVAILFSRSNNIKALLSLHFMRIGKIILQILLAPLSLLYWLLSGFHHLSYTKSWKKSIKFDLPIINIGNLNTGGTGKTPHIAYITSFLSDYKNTAILSRGYGRKSRGYKEVQLNNSSEEVGDEPLLLKQKNPENLVFVCEERVLAIPQILHSYPETEVILLDDAFQHRRIQASINILLTCYDNLYINDFPLPSGRLREPKIGANRAQAVIITKCPKDLNESELLLLRKKLKLKKEQDLFYSRIIYGEPYYFKNPTNTHKWSKSHNYQLICGIALPEYLMQHIENQDINFDTIQLKDHQEFSKKLLENLESQCLKDNSIKIITTEKDSMRLKSKIKAYPNLYNSIIVLPISISLGNSAKAFHDKLLVWSEKNKESI